LLGRRYQHVNLLSEGGGEKNKLSAFSTGDPHVDEDGNVYGVDSRSLLAVTDRGVGEGAGDYSRLPDDEQL
jgi:hypothetical protein